MDSVKLCCSSRGDDGVASDASGVASHAEGSTLRPRTLLKPFLTVVPLCMFLLLDIYWKYETLTSCKSPESCTPAELVRLQKSVIKSQRNALLITSALMFYWLLYHVTHLIVQLELMNETVEKLSHQE